MWVAALVALCASVPAQEIEKGVTVVGLFRARAFVCPQTQEVFPVDAQTMVKNFALFSDGAAAMRVSDDGTLRFRAEREKVTLYWGNVSSAQPLDKRIHLWAGNYDVLLKVRQSEETASKWTLRFWCDGRREKPRKDRSRAADIPLTGTQEQTLTFRRRVSFIRKVSYPDGMEIVVRGAKGNETEIRSMQMTRPSYQGYFRNEFVVPEGKIWRAVATVSLPVRLYVNGEEVPDDTPVTPRPQASAYLLTKPVDLTPYLKVGRNCVGVAGVQQGSPGPLYLQARVIMEDGTTTDLNTDGTWVWKVDPSPGWCEAGFDATGWDSAGELDAEQSPQVKSIEDLQRRRPAERPAYDGLMVLENPYERSLYYTDTKPAIVKVRIPGGLAPRAPVVEWEVKRCEHGLVDIKSLDTHSSGSRSEAATADGSLVYTLNMGRLARGVYTLQTRLRSGETLIEERIPEPFVVVGRIPMKQAAGDFYEQGMALSLETEIDFTDPDGPHPWLEVDGSNIPRKRSRLKSVPEAHRQGVQDPIIVKKNGLRYRETRANRGAQFSYKVEFEHPGDFYLMVLEYPDDRERWMGASCCSRRRGISAYSKIGPSVVTGWKYPLTHTMQELKWIYRPDPGPHTVNVMTLKSGMAGAAARLRIHHIKGGLPEMGGHRSGERRLGLLTENTNMENSFGHTYSITREDKDSQADRGRLKTSAPSSPVARACMDLLAWQDTSEAYARYLRFTGQNLHVIGCYQYRDRPNEITYRPCPDISTSRLVMDLRDVAVRVFRENGIGVVGGVEFIMQMSHGRSPIACRNNGQVQAGGDTVYLVNRDGLQQANWNFIHPLVEKLMLQVADEIAEKWEDQPNFLGENWRAYPGGGFVIPTFGQSADPLSVGYGDATIRRFREDTGIDLPGTAGDAAGGGASPARFRQRYEFLTSEPMKERWIQWRADRMKQLFVKISERMKARRQDLRCYASLHFDVNHAVEWKQSGLPFRDYLRNMGWDIEEMKQSPDLWTTHLMYAHARYKRDRTGSGYAASWEMSVGDECYELFSREMNRCQANLHHWQEIERVAFTLPDRDGWAYPYQSTMQAQAGGYNANEVFTQGLIGGDPELVMFGFSHVSLMGGHEQPMREFVRVLRALPREKFRPVLKTGLKTNLAIRDLRTDGQYLFYVANPGHWPIRGSITLDAPGQVQDLVSGQPVVPEEIGGKVSLPVSLRPYGVKAYASDSPRARIVAWQTEPVAERDLQHLRSFIREAESALGDLVLSRLLPPQIQDTVRESAEAAAKHLNAGRYAQAWSVLTHWKFWTLLHNEVSKANRFDPWLVVGPSVGQAGADGTVRYPALSKEQPGWQEVRRTESGPPLVVYVDRAGSGDWAARYAATEVKRSRNETVLLLLGKKDDVNVWLNGAHVGGSLKRVNDQPLQYGAGMRLRKGWNRIVATVAGQEFERMPGFLTVVAPDTGSCLEALTYRAPQTRLAGPKTTYRVNCGASEIYVDRRGNVWLPDHDYHGWVTDRIGFGYLSGKVAKRPGRQIKGTNSSALFRRERWGLNGYRFLVPNGAYTVRLHFAETYKPGVGRRVFKVSAQEGEPLTLDVFDEKGMDTALAKTFEKVQVTDGVLKIDFEGVSFPACQEINAIEVMRDE